MIPYIYIYIYMCVCVCVCVHISVLNNIITLLPLEHAMTQLVEIISYKLEDCRFDSRWRHYPFLIYLPTYRAMSQGLTQPLTDSSTRKLLLGIKRAWHVRLTTSPPSASLSSRIVSFNFVAWVHSDVTSLKICILRIVTEIQIIEVYNPHRK
jgi:hypothetical protein